MSTLQELKAQKDLLDKQIVEARKSERKEAVAQIRALMLEYDIKEIKLKEPVKVAAKWQDPESGKQWSGRGRTPLWFGVNSIQL